MDALTKERRLAINGLISHWMSEQDPEGRVLDTLDYFDVDKIDELIDEAIAPAIADAVAVALAAIYSDAAQAPTAWRITNGDALVAFVETKATKESYERDGFHATPLYAAPVAPAAPTDERAAFEDAWRREMNAEVFDLHRTEYPMTHPDKQQYGCHETNRGWIIWQVARATQQATKGDGWAAWQPIATAPRDGTN